MKEASKVLRWLSFAASVYHLFNYVFISLPVMLLLYLPPVIISNIFMLPLIIMPFVYIPMVVVSLVPFAVSIIATIASIVAVVKSARNKPSLASGVLFIAVSTPIVSTTFFNGILLIVWAALRMRIEEKEQSK